MDFLFGTIFLTFLCHNFGKIHGNRQCYGYDQWKTENSTNVTKFIAQMKNAEWCISIVKQPKLPLNESRHFCQMNFPSGELLTFENVEQLKTELVNLKNFWPNEIRYVNYDAENETPDSCWKLHLTSTDVTKVMMTHHDDCSETRPFMCKYPFQHNCAWRYQDVEEKEKIVNKMLFQQNSDFDHSKPCAKVGNMPRPQMTKELKECTYPRFEQEWSTWSPCTAKCTNVLENPPIQRRERGILAKCSAFMKNRTSADVALFDWRTCNLDVNCLNTESQNSGSESPNPADVKVEPGVTSNTESPIIILLSIVVCVIVVIVLVLVVVAVVISRRSRSGKEKISKSSEKEAKKFAKSKKSKKSAKQNDNFGLTPVIKDRQVKTVRETTAAEQNKNFGNKKVKMEENLNKKMTKSAAKKMSKPLIGLSSKTVPKKPEQVGKIKDDSSCLSLPSLSNNADLFTIPHKGKKKRKKVQNNKKQA